MGSLLRSASVGRERSTATPPAALIKLRESASKSKARRQGGPRTATSGTSWPRRPRVRRRDGGESERRRHTGSQIPQPPCYRRPGSGRATVTFSGSTKPVWASADPLPVPSCGVAFRPERCRRITCALQQCQQPAGLSTIQKRPRSFDEKLYTSLEFSNDVVAAAQRRDFFLLGVSHTSLLLKMFVFRTRKTENVRRPKHFPF